MKLKCSNKNINKNELLSIFKHMNRKACDANINEKGEFNESRKFFTGLISENNAASEFYDILCITKKYKDVAMITMYENMKYSNFRYPVINEIFKYAEKCKLKVLVSSDKGRYHYVMVFRRKNLSKAQLLLYNFDHSRVLNFYNIGKLLGYSNNYIKGFYKMTSNSNFNVHKKEHTKKINKIKRSKEFKEFKKGLKMIKFSDYFQIN